MDQPKSVPGSTGIRRQVPRVGTFDGTHQQASRVANQYQPGHKFLDQLTSKSPMCLVNEICRHHRLRQEYILLHTSGPDHNKKFSGKTIDHK